MADRKLEVVITGDASSLQRSLGKAGMASSSFGSKLKTVGKAAAVAGVALGGAFVVGAVKAVDAASDLGEQVSKTGVVFGKSSKEVHTWSKGLASSFGLSQRAALEAAGTYGNMLVPMGFSRKEAAGMSKQFVELSADMASFNNARPEETLDALRAGLAGETEPLRRFGVFLNDARIKSQAAAMGFKLVKGQLDPMAKAAATAAIIMKDTSDTQGDFGRTSGSLANQQRILKAQLENSAAAIGAALLPAATALMTLLAKIVPHLTAFGLKLAEAVGPVITAGINAIAPAFEKLKEAVAQAVEWGQQLLDFLRGSGTESTIASAAIIGLAGAVGGLIVVMKAVTLATKAWAVAQAILNAVMAANPFVLIAAALIGLGIALVVAYQRSETFREIVNAVFAKVKAVVQDAIAVVTRVIQTLTPTFHSAARVAQQLWESIRGVVDGIVRVIRGMVDVVVGILTGDWGRAWKGLKTVAQGAWQIFASWLQGLPALVLGWAKDIGIAIMQGIWDGVSGLIGWLKGKIESALGFIKSLNPFSTVEEGGAKYIGEPLAKGVIKGWITGTAELPSKVSDTVRTAVEKAAEAFKAQKGVFASAVEETTSAAMKVFDDFASEFQTKTEKLLAKMSRQDTVAGLAGSIEDAKAALEKAKLDQAWNKVMLPDESVDEWLARVKSANEAVASAQAAYDAALKAKRVDTLQGQAQDERTAFDAQLAAWRGHFAKRLEELNMKLEEGRISVGVWQQRVLELINSKQVPFQNAGKALATKLAKGLKDEFGEVQRAADELRRIVVTSLSGITIRLAVSISGGSSVLSGKRQHGGPVSGGRAYLVGEGGPELFIPTSGGKVAPIVANRSAGGGGGMVNIFVAGSVWSAEELVQVVRRELVRDGRRNVTVLPGVAG